MLCDPQVMVHMSASIMIDKSKNLCQRLKWTAEQPQGSLKKKYKECIETGD